MVLHMSTNRIMKCWQITVDNRGVNGEKTIHLIIVLVYKKMLGQLEVLLL